jgi:hypothetical protein
MGTAATAPAPLPTDPSISDTTVSDVRVTMTAVQHTLIWIVSPAAGPKSPMPPDRVWRAVGRRLAAETVRSLEGLIAWLAVAGISALARRAWRPALPAPAPGLSARTRRELHWGHGDGSCCAACPSCPSFPARTQSARLPQGGKSHQRLSAGVPVLHSPAHDLRHHSNVDRQPGGRHG